MPTLPDFHLETYLSRWEFSARYHLSASDAESMTLGELLAMASAADRAAFENLSLGYTETYGAPDLREAIAETYAHRERADILCFAGAEEGLYVAMHALLEAGDHAVVVTPNYASAATIPLSLCDVTGVPLDPEDHWSLDLDRLRSALRPNTRLVSINFPHNPTGKVLERETFDALVALCRQRGLWLFSDEVYRGLERDAALRLPQVADAYERGLSLNVMSKAYGLPGLRIGWIAAQDREVLGRMERFKHYLSICNAGPSEHLARIALRAREPILARTRAIAASNLALLADFYRDFEGRLEGYAPDGGVVAFPRYLGDEGVEAFTSRLVEERGVLLLPASVYATGLGEAPGDRFRIGFGRADFPAGLSELRDFVGKLPG